MTMIIEDHVSTEDLYEEIEALGTGEDVQSVDTIKFDKA
jgi:hypothetical protein